MLLPVIVSLLLLSLAVTVGLIVVTLIKCVSTKKNFFVLALFSMIFFLLGSIMEFTSRSTDAAFTAVKIMYIGSCFAAPMFMLFVGDYCEVNLHKWYIVLPAVALPLTDVVLVWTTAIHHLIYKKIEFSAAFALPGLIILEQGALYNLVTLISLLCTVVSCGIILYRLHTWSRSYRNSLLVVLLSAVVPFIAHMASVITTYIYKSSAHGVNLTPFAFVLSDFFLYVSVLRFDLFDLAPRAYSQTLELIRDAFIFVDQDIRYIGSNSRAKALFPGLARLQKGRPVSEIQNWPEELLNIDDEQPASGVNFSLNDGEERFFNAWINRVEQEEKEIGSIILIQDTTESVQLLRQLEDAAYTDGLTGLYNRRHFMQLAAVEIEKSRRFDTKFFLAIFDLDFFKRVNDTYGHLAGDEILRTVARTVKNTMRAYDVLGRYGGEEFVILMADSDEAVAFAMTERIRENVAAIKCEYGASTISITCSIGVAEGSADISLDEILNNADTALYRAKETGRNKTEIYRKPL